MMPLGYALRGFSDVDAQVDPQAFLSYLDLTNSDPLSRIRKQSVLNLLGPTPGNHILEVGCGAGHMLFEAVNGLGAVGRFTGIDSSSIMIDEARRRAGRYLNGLIDFIVEDAHHLSFIDNYFDAAFCISTLIHVRDPRQVLSELLRVVKPGKRIALQEGDWESFVICTGVQEIDETVTSVMRKGVRNGGIAHQLPSLMKRLGFTRITVEASALMLEDFKAANQIWRILATIEEARKSQTITSAQGKASLDALSETVSTGHFFAAALGVVVTGEKPL